MLRALLLLAALLSSPAWATTAEVATPASPPTDYEAVDATPRILVARAKRQVGSAMRFEIEEVLKGDRLKYMHVEGGPSFEAGRLYLAFLDRHEDGWTISELVDQGIEAVEPRNDWLRTVRLFAEVSALDDPKQEREALRELKTAAEEDRDGRYPEGLAKRIADHFATPSRYKSFADLVSLYQEAEDDVDRREVLWALVNAAHPETSGFFVGLLFANEPDWLLQPLVTWFRDRPDDLPRMAELGRAYLGRPAGERGLLLHLMLEAARVEDGPVLWTLLPSSDRGEIQTIANEVLEWPALEMERLSVPDDERVKTDLLAIWLSVNTSDGARGRLEALLRKAREPLVEVFAQAADSSHLPDLWPRLLRANDREADLILEWAATRVPLYEALVETYRGARTDEERNRALWVAAAAWRNGQLGRFLAEVGALGPGADRLRPIARAFLSCPSPTTRWNILGDLETLAVAQDLPVMLEILRGTDPWEALFLARWFALHPTPEALPWLARLPLAAYEDAWWEQARAACGDPEVLDRAIDHLSEGDHDVWSIGIVAWSPLPAAEEEARRLLAEGGDRLHSLVIALREEGNQTPWRDELLERAVRPSS